MNSAARHAAEGILFTDEYQLTMAQLYYRMGLHEKQVQFEHFFRSYPDYGSHRAGYCVNAGLGWFLDWMRESRFRADDIEYLRSLRGQTDRRLFGDDFLGWLRENDGFDRISLSAIPEGRVVHPLAPITVVSGPLAMAQMLETPLLNQINYQILVATKTARVRQSAHGQPVVEFGLRRAQDRGANAGTRAALIGGADFSSNVGMSRALGYSPIGTHAHSMVQVFMALGGGEIGAFRAYAEVYPDDCLLLVDTLDTLGSGIPNAVKVFEELRSKGHEPVGIRLDSGDLAHLSIQAAEMLDAAGFPETKIVLSNQLDEIVIWQIVTQILEESPRRGLDADKVIRRLVFGVGTRLITSEGAPALDGVYKLVAVRNGNEWMPAIKLSETPEKTLNPGEKKAWRLYDRRGMATADLLSLPDENPREMAHVVLQHPTEPTKRRTLPREEISQVEPLLVKVVEEGRLVCDMPTIEEMRALRQSDVDRLDDGVRRFVNPHLYHVSLTERLWKKKQEAVEAAREGSRLPG